MLLRFSFLLPLEGPVITVSILLTQGFQQTIPFNWMISELKIPILKMEFTEFDSDY